MAAMKQPLAPFSDLDKMLCDLAQGLLSGAIRSILQLMVASDPELQRKYELIKALYAEDTGTADAGLGEAEEAAAARLWAPWTPWLRDEAGIRMMRAEDYGPEAPAVAGPGRWSAAAMTLKAAALPAEASEDVENTLPVLQNVISSPCVAVRRFAPRGGSVFSPEAALALQCRGLPVSDGRFVLTLGTEGGKGTVVFGADPAWKEERAMAPEENREIRRVWMQKTAAEWLGLLGCAVPAPDAAVEVRFAFEAENGLAWASGDSFRVAGQAWFDSAEQDIQHKLRAWPHDRESLRSVTERFRRALEAAQWGKDATASLVWELEALTHGPLCEPIRRALLYYCAGLDCRATGLVERTLLEYRSAGNLLRVLGLLCAERSGVLECC